YVAYLKARPLKNSSKRVYLLWVKAWTNHAKKALFLHGTQITNYFDYIENPFKGENTCDGNLKVDLDMDTTDNIKALNDEQMDQILRAAELRSRALFIMLTLLKHTGLRLSEAVTIRTENINLAERVIASGIIKNHRKTGKVFYFVPPAIATELRSYILSLNDGAEWLFPSPVSPSHYTTSHFEKMIRNISIVVGFHFTAHQFRHTLIAKRHKLGCPPHVNDLLQNHTASGTQAKFYRERNLTLRDRRAFYDKWHPYK
ncbi:MAG: tyrosine-type recombinase/integrase, partial [Candidatus Sigynarchaeota archaeon]